jgi:hypothetical protein
MLCRQFAKTKPGSAETGSGISANEQRYRRDGSIRLTSDEQDSDSDSVEMTRMKMTVI